MQFIVYAWIAAECGRLGWDMSDLTISLLLAVASFPLLVALSIATVELIEKPFLELRAQYVGGRTVAPSSPAASQSAILARA